MRLRSADTPTVCLPLEAEGTLQLSTNPSPGCVLPLANLNRTHCSRTEFVRSAEYLRGRPSYCSGCSTSMEEH